MPSLRVQVGPLSLLFPPSQTCVNRPNAVSAPTTSELNLAMVIPAAPRNLRTSLHTFHSLQAAILHGAASPIFAIVAGNLRNNLSRACARRGANRLCLRWDALLPSLPPVCLARTRAFPRFLSLHRVMDCKNSPTLARAFCCTNSGFHSSSSQRECPEFRYPRMAFSAIARLENKGFLRLSVAPSPSLPTRRGSVSSSA